MKKKAILLIMFMSCFAWGKAQEIFIHQLGDTLNFYLPATGNKEIIMIDSVLISRNNNRVICDLKTKPLSIRACFPAGDVFIPAKEIDLDHYKIGTYVLAATFIDTVNITNGSAVFYLPVKNGDGELISKCLLSPGQEFSYSSLDGYHYQGVKPTKTKTNTTISYSEEKLNIQRDVIKTVVIPWEILVSTIIIILTALAINIKYYEWKAWYDLGTEYRRFHKRKPDYADISIVSCFSLLFSAQLPTITRPNFDLFILSAIILIVLICIIAYAFFTVSSLLMKINRWIGLSFIITAQCLLLGSSYGYSPLLILLPLAISPSIIFRKAIKARWGVITEQEMLEVLGKVVKNQPSFDNPLYIKAKQ